MFTQLLLALVVGFAGAGVLYVNFWPAVAWIVSRPAVAQALWRRAELTPYWNLEGYMNRWWVFNPIWQKFMINGQESVKAAEKPWSPISIRMHHILRADDARHPHNHPGSFRTIILKGWYLERRDDGMHFREVGDTTVLKHGEFHHIAEVSPGGVWTLFIMWDWRSTWGFRMDDGRVVHHKEYNNGGMP